MIKILSCNVRYFGADDGENNWVHRRDVCAEVMRRERPDIIGVQEMWREQFVDMQARLPEFASYGLMHDATSRHPANCIFYHKDVFDLVAAGGYWLSETPHVPGSRSWKSKGERLVNWVRLVERRSQVEFRVVNTHLDHMSAEARFQGARLICEDAAVYPADYPQILLGDMNSNQTSKPITQFKKAGWTDTYETVYGTDAGNTFHAFKGEDVAADYGQIDWVFTRGEIDVLDAAVLDDDIDGRYPSDHYFMAADVELTGQTIWTQLPQEARYIAPAAVYFAIYSPSDTEDFVYRDATPHDWERLSVLASRIREQGHLPLFEQLIEQNHPDEYTETLLVSNLLFVMDHFVSLQLSNDENADG